MFQYSKHFKLKIDSFANSEKNVDLFPKSEI